MVSRRLSSIEIEFSGPDALVAQDSGDGGSAHFFPVSQEGGHIVADGMITEVSDMTLARFRWCA